MKNRNIPYYVAALMLAAGVSTSFVSCVDTDEPETVTKLRQEAINKLAADTDLQKALAEVQRAEAAYKNAQAAAENADAQKNLADAKKQELINAKTEKTNDAVIAKEIAEANKAAQKAIEDQASATQTYKLAAADYERALKAAQKEAEENAAKLGSTDEGSIVAKYLEAYITAQKDVLEKQVAYNDALINVKVGEDGVDENGNAFHKNGTVDFEAEVSLKTVAKNLAQDAYDETVAIFEDPDFTKWSKTYADAQTAIDNLESEIAEIDLAVATKKAEINVKEQQISDAEKAITTEFDKWADTDAQIPSIEVSDNLKKAIFGENNNDLGPYKIDTKWIPGYYENNNYVSGYDQRISVKLHYSNKKVQILLETAKEVNVYDQETGDWQYSYTENEKTSAVTNEFAADALDYVLTKILNGYSNSYEANSLKEAYDNALKNYNEGIKLTVEGNSEGATDEAKKGELKLFNEAWAAYKGTVEDKKNAYEIAADNLLGRHTDLDGHDLNGKLPSKEDVLDNWSSWGDYGNYLHEQEYVAEAQSNYTNFVEANGIYNTIKGKQKEYQDAYDAKNTEKEDKLINDANLATLKAELKELQIAKSDEDSKKALKEIEKDKNEAVQTAINTACGIDFEGDEDLSDAGITGFDDIAKAKEVLVALAKVDLDKATAELEAAQEALKQHNAGTSDVQVAVEYAKKQVEIAQEKCDVAKAQYEAVKKVYETKAE
jgi:hypothetical protein